MPLLGALKRPVCLCNINMCSYTCFTVFLVLGVQPSVLNYIIVLSVGCKVISLTGEGRGAVLTVVSKSEWL